MVNERLAEAQDDPFVAVLVADAVCAAQAARTLTGHLGGDDPERLPTTWESLLAELLGLSPAALASWCDELAAPLR